MTTVSVNTAARSINEFAFVSQKGISLTGYNGQRVLVFKNAATYEYPTRLITLLKTISQRKKYIWEPTTDAGGKISLRKVLVNPDVVILVGYTEEARWKIGKLLFKEPISLTIVVSETVSLTP